jgi:hypothetical protein
LVMTLYVVFTPLAVKERAPMMKTLMSTAIKAYSIAVAPASAAPNLRSPRRGAR